MSLPGFLILLAVIMGIGTTIAVVWIFIRLFIWIIKTAIKEALEEYEEEKES